MLSSVVVWALLLGARTGLPDAYHLAVRADAAGVPVEVAWAMAWEESRANLNPRLRGAHGEWGRFQIHQTGAVRSRCRDLDIRTYDGNVACYFRVMPRYIERYGLADAIMGWNGSGPDARAYRQRVAATAYFLQRGERACAASRCG